MSASFRSGLLAGFIAGAAVTGLVVLVLRPSPPPADPRSPVPATAEGAKKSAEETKKPPQIAEAEKARPVPPATPAKEEKSQPETPASAEVGPLFARLVEAGLAGFRSPKFAETLEAVKKGGKPSIDYLAGVLQSSLSATERFLAAALLEGAGDAGAIPGLAAALKNDKDDLVRRMASHGLAMLGNPDAQGPLREAATGDSDWGVRVNSAYGLAKLKNDDGLRILQDAYESSSTPSEYRLAVLGGLADVAAPSSAPLFRKILTDTQDSSYVLAAIGALEKMKDAEALPALQQLANSSPSQIVKQAATKAIDAIRK
jgi:hypothetical protein